VFDSIAPDLRSRFEPVAREQLKVEGDSPIVVQQSDLELLNRRVGAAVGRLNVLK
jgi:hypothetical protein